MTGSVSVKAWGGLASEGTAMGGGLRLVAGSPAPRAAGRPLRADRAAAALARGRDGASAEGAVRAVHEGVGVSRAPCRLEKQTTGVPSFPNNPASWSPPLPLRAAQV